MGKKVVKPPALAQWLVSKFSVFEDLFSLSQDLGEEYSHIFYQKGKWSAWKWFWFQALLIFLHYSKLLTNWRINMLKNYINVALKNIRKHKLHSFINVAGLSIGFALVMIIAAYVLKEVSTDTYHKNYKKIYRLEKAGISSSMNAPIKNLLDKKVPGLESMARVEFFRTKKSTVRYNGQPITVKNLVFADPEIFNIFTFKKISGDLNSALINPFSLVLCKKEALRLFGEEDPIGKTILYKNKHNLRVTAVIQDLPYYSSLTLNGIISFPTLFKLRGEKFMNRWGNFNYEAYLLLNNRKNWPKVEQIINDIVKKEAPKAWRKMVVKLNPFREIYFSNQTRDYLRHGNWQVLMIISLVGVLILVIAIINFINLSISKAFLRAREIGVRKVLGSKKSQLITQFLTESMVLCLFSAVGGLILSNLMIPAFNTMTNSELTQNNPDSVWFWILVVFGTILIGTMAGIYPAFYLTSYKTVNALKAKVVVGTKGYLFRKGLIVFQFTVSVILICSISLIYKQFNLIDKKDLGFDKEGILLVRVSPQVSANMDVFKNNVLRHPNIKKASHSHFVPGIEGRQFWTNNFNYRGKIREIGFAAAYVSSNYLDFMGMKIVKGRNFNKERAGDKNTCIINETFIKENGIENPLKIKIPTWTSEGAQVIGVVEDFCDRSLHHPIEPLVLFNSPDSCSYVSLKLVDIGKASLNKTIQNIAREWQSVSPGFPFEYLFLDSGLENLYKKESHFRSLLTSFSIFSIFLACLGVLGLSSFSAGQRSQEIGIRKILGASVTQILKLLSKEFVYMVLIANAIAWPISWYLMDQWLKGFAFRISISPVVFIISGLLVIVLTVFTVWFYAFKAANSNPIEAIRYE
jgi:putative ABC transport system permease protein